MDAYCAELAARLVRAADAAAAYTVESVYFGGGTPSYLGCDRLAALLECVRTHYALAPDAEITFEANPDSARDVSALRTLRQAGFDRISLGAQSFDDAELKSVGRIHTASEIAEAVDAARAAGFTNLSLDLIYGLPRQTKAGFLASLRAAVALRPEHLSCYGLKVEPGTPLWARRDTAELPDDEAQSDCYLAAVSYLAEQGYAQYEISNFARPGYESRHNLKYWTLGEYLGFGPGAHSDFGGRRFGAARSLDAFLRGEEQYDENSVPSPRERAAERVMLALRTARGLAPDALPMPLTPALPFLRRCAEAGLARESDGRWSLTPRGFLVSNRIIVEVQERLGL